MPSHESMSRLLVEYIQTVRELRDAEMDLDVRGEPPRSANSIKPYRLRAVGLTNSERTVKYVPCSHSVAASTWNVVYHGSDPLCPTPSRLSRPPSRQTDSDLAYSCLLSYCNLRSIASTTQLGMLSNVQRAFLSTPTYAPVFHASLRETSSIIHPSIGEHRDIPFCPAFAHTVRATATKQ